MNLPSSNRRWFQYGLRSLLILMTVAGCALGWLAVKVQAGKRQRAAAQAINMHGGQVIYDYQLDPVDDSLLDDVEPAEPTWLRELLGDDFFHDVVKVRIVSDAQLAQVKQFARLQSLAFNYESKVSDAALIHLQDLPQLQRLDFHCNRTVTDAGLVHLTPLTQLERLDMCFSGITDSGLAHLHGLTRLQELHVHATRLTPDGLQKLQQALPNCRVKR